MNEYIFDYSQYKNSINIKNKFNFTLIFLLIIVLLGLAVYLKPTTQKQELHFVEIESFQSYNQALKFAQTVSNSGDAGYIYFDSKYHVLSSFHSSENDAKSVVDNLKKDHRHASVFTISIKHNINKKSHNKALINFSNESLKIGLLLDELIIKFEKKELKQEAFSFKLNQLKTEFDEVFANIKTAIEKNTKYNLTIKYASTMSNSISKLCNTNEFSRNIFKFEHINYMINYYRFLSCF